MNILHDGRRQVKKVLLSCARLTPIDNFDDHDIFIVGYPKSGITWFQHILAGIVYNVDVTKVRFRYINKLIPDIHMKKYYRRYHTPMFFKTHNLPHPLYRRIIYLIRDGRDVMVSLYHYRSAINGGNINFLDMVKGKTTGYGKWHEHVESWLSNPHKSKMLIVKYEGLLHEPIHTLNRLCSFIGINKDKGALKSISENAAFEKLQKKEISCGLDNSEWPRDKPFFRRGIAGSYKDEMPADVLKAFMSEAGGTLKRLGYA